jgi:hypothetical protein
MSDDHDALVERVAEQRSAAWRQVGELAPDVVAHLINPAFMGGPRWPALRQAFAKITLADGTALIASDGLSDPNDGTTDAGWAAEVYLASPLAPVAVADLASHWQFSVVYQVAQNIANGIADLGGMLAKYGALSMGIPGLDLPEDWRDGQETGVLIGVPHPSVPASIRLETGDVALVQVTVLRPAELRHILTGGADARRELAARMATLDPRALAAEDRPSLI